MTSMLAVASQAPRRVLLVEDDPAQSSLLRGNLEAAGYRVQVAGNGEEALRQFEKLASDLVLLDIVLPDISGLEICRRMRANDEVRQPAIIIVAFPTQESDRVASFEVGADDFVTKSFSLSELMLRIQARLRSHPANERAALEAPEPMRATRQRRSLGPLEIDMDSHRVFLSGKEINLSVQEMRLLIYLASEPSKLRTRGDLMTAVWGYHPEATSRTLDAHIKRLRDKFGPLATMVQTVHGVGYRLAFPAPQTRPGGHSSHHQRRR